MAKQKPDDDGRDKATGRFTPGNKLSPGSPVVRRAHALRRSLQKAISAKDLREAAQGVLKAAKAGDAQAMRVLCDHVLGKPRTQPEDVPAIALPPLQSAGDCAAAVDAIVAGITSGAVTGDGARLLLEVVEARRRAIETVELSARIGEVEKHLGKRDF